MNSNLNNTKTIKEGTYKGHYFYIRLIRNSHLTAYVQEKPNFLDVNNIIACHGGVTYHDTPWWNNDPDTYIGWDYAHTGDWASYCTDEENIRFNNKRWTVEEVFEEVKYVIEQMLKLGI